MRVLNESNAALIQEALDHYRESLSTQLVESGQNPKIANRIRLLKRAERQLSERRPAVR